MKLLLLLLSIILSLSFIDASVNVKYASCVGTCYCGAAYIENLSGDGWETFTIPDYPEYYDFFGSFKATYVSENKTIAMVGDNLNHDYLTYPINVNDNSYDVPECAYAKSSKFNDGTCAYFMVCNDSTTLSVGHLLIIAAIALSSFFLLF